MNMSNYANKQKKVVSLIWSQNGAWTNCEQFTLLCLSQPKLEGGEASFSSLHYTLKNGSGDYIEVAQVSRTLSNGSLEKVQVMSYAKF